FSTIGFPPNPYFHLGVKQTNNDFNFFSFLVTATSSWRHRGEATNCAGRKPTRCRDGILTVGVRMPRATLSANASVTVRDASALNTTTLSLSPKVVNRWLRIVRYFKLGFKSDKDLVDKTLLRGYSCDINFTDKELDVIEMAVYGDVTRPGNQCRCRSVAEVFGNHKLNDHTAPLIVHSLHKGAEFEPAPRRLNRDTTTNPGQEQGSCQDSNS
ncbi:LOW QUALITY PROTEIN: hypothetical protein M8C21_011092, partial [Ambrosia artemisiifolia]